LVGKSSGNGNSLSTKGLASHGERGKPEDVAAVVRFLCGPAARYINGQAIHANGGAYLGA
jgi:NAD(P)-dependent dehydrogenase (short-subunit alcohol dehydrogenase family)